MKRVFFPLKLIASLIILASCSKRTVPQKSAGSQIDYKKEETNIKAESAPTAPTAPVRKQPVQQPNVITVNDAAASKSVDGRLYYDVNGKRYWKNYKDGKYYLFNKSMYENPDFRPPSGQ